MSGRHRRTRTTPARCALLGTVPLVGGAGLVTGLLTGAPPETVAPAAMATTAPPPAPAPPGATASGALPGHGETAMDAVAGARDAVQAHRADHLRDAREVSTVARELRIQAEERAARARAAGDAELAAYQQEEAERQKQAEESSRPVVAEHEAPESDPGEQCTSTDLLRLGPLAVAGPHDPECEVDPWVADQVRDAAERN